jgi:hypothetical protein
MRNLISIIWFLLNSKGVIPCERRELTRFHHNHLFNGSEAELILHGDVVELDGGVIAEVLDVRLDAALPPETATRTEFASFLLALLHGGSP